MLELAPLVAATHFSTDCQKQ